MLAIGRVSIIFARLWLGNRDSNPRSQGLAEALGEEIDCEAGL